MVTASASKFTTSRKYVADERRRAFDAPPSWRWHRGNWRDTLRQRRGSIVRRPKPAVRESRNNERRRPALIDALVGQSTSLLNERRQCLASTACLLHASTCSSIRAETRLHQTSQLVFEIYGVMAVIVVADQHLQNRAYREGIIS